MYWVEGVLVVVSVPASHDCCLDSKFIFVIVSLLLQEEWQHHDVSQSS